MHIIQQKISLKKPKPNKHKKEEEEIAVGWLHCLSFKKIEGKINCTQAINNNKWEVLVGEKLQLHSNYVLCIKIKNHLSGVKMVESMPTSSSCVSSLCSLELWCSPSPVDSDTWRVLVLFFSVSDPFRAWFLCPCLIYIM